MSLGERWCAFERAVAISKKPSAIVARQPVHVLGEAAPLPIVAEVRGEPIQRK